MCAILGMIALPGCTLENPEAMRIFGGLLEAGMSRGVDATGLAWTSVSDCGQSAIYADKAPLPAADFVAERLAGVWPHEMPCVVIGHTRASTKGPESNNLNNHPVLDARAGIAAVHNGCMRNDDDLFNQYGIERDAEVDSEIIPKLIGYHYWDGDAEVRGNMDAAVKKAAEELSGSFAFLVMSAYHPGMLWLVKNRNPASLCLIPDWRVILVASLDEYFDHALGEHRVWLSFFETNECDTRKIVRDVDAATIIRIDANCENDDSAVLVSAFAPLVESQRPGSLLYSYTTGAGRPESDEWGCLRDVLSERRSPNTSEQRAFCLWRVEGSCMEPGERCGDACTYGSGSFYGERCCSDTIEASEERGC